MDTTPRFPPSARDFQVYQRVTLEAATTRQAAADFSISQTRVRQIVQRVSLWLAETLPPRDDTTDAAHLNLAQHIAADRLQLMYGQAMHGWRLTNQAKYAGVVLRCIAAQGKMPVSPGTLDALIADAIEGPLPDEPTTLARSASEGNAASSCDARDRRQSAICNPQSAIPSPPPPGDCSATARQQPVPAMPAVIEQSITPTATTPSDDTADARSAARRAFFAPAQPPLSPCDSLSTSVTELKITPQQLGASLQKKLSRRERRRLRAKIGS